MPVFWACSSYVFPKNCIFSEQFFDTFPKQCLSRQLLLAYKSNSSIQCVFKYLFQLHSSHYQFHILSWLRKMITIIKVKLSWNLKKKIIFPAATNIAMIAIACHGVLSTIVMLIVHTPHRKSILATLHFKSEQAVRNSQLIWKTVVSRAWSFFIYLLWKPAEGK